MKKNASVTFKEACERLKISGATLRNWIKLEKISARKTDAGLTFTLSEVRRLERALKDESNKTLKTRRNKTKRTGNQSFKHHFLRGSVNAAFAEDLVRNATEVCDETFINACLYDCARKLFANRFKTDLNKHKAWKELLLPFAEHDDKGFDFDAYPFQYIEGEDTLGLLYLSLLDVQNMKSSGTYYTPSLVVNAMLAELSFGEETASSTLNVLDPCCGTGSFLLRLPLSVPPQYIYGCDLDETACAITRINLALKYSLKDASSIKLLQHRILCADFLSDTLPFGNVFFDRIIGNPPWGYAYSADEKKDLKKRFKCAKTASPESADLFLEKGLQCLSNEGTLSFVLPEAVLYVRKHEPVREYICDKAKLKSLTYLGNAFEGVQCPAVAMQLALKSGWETAFEDAKELHLQGARVRIDRRVFTVNTMRHMHPDNFHLICDDKEFDLLQRIKEGSDRVYLKDNAQFALGIVTGSNASMLFDEPVEGTEPILTGSDILPYRILKPSRFIAFDKDKVQQAAKEELYRAPDKLLYRFVSSGLVFARDKESRLSLNSCNVLIPQLPGYDTAYVLAILNSGVAQFYYKKTWRSIKVLKSYIEAIPIPVCRPATQHKIMRYVAKLTSMDVGKPFDDMIKVLDLTICSLYGLSADDYAMIRRALNR